MAVVNIQKIQKLAIIQMTTFRCRFSKINKWLLVDKDRQEISKIGNTWQHTIPTNLNENEWMNHCRHEDYWIVTTVSLKKKLQVLS